MRNFKAHELLSVILLYKMQLFVSVSATSGVNYWDKNKDELARLAKL